MRTVIIKSFFCISLLCYSVYSYGEINIDEKNKFSHESENIVSKRNNILKFVSEYVPPTPSEKLHEVALDEYPESVNNLYKYIIYILQLEQGFNDNEITGFLNKFSRAILPEKIDENSDDVSIKLVQAALNLNGYICPIDGIWSKVLSDALADFQLFMSIKQSGVADNETLQSLFSSGGNINKKVIGCDCAQQLSPGDISFLKLYGYKYIGRYLTSKENGRQKHITKEELYALLDAGFRVILFFQEGMHDFDHCTAEQGIIDAQKAVIAAQKLGLKRGAVIYGVIDDDLDPIIVSGYIESMSNTLRKHGYDFGIYGSRAICNFAYEQGLASFSYVAGISHNYAGNKGYQMPKNWSFNQEIQIDAGTINNQSLFDIDNVIVSGIDPGITAKDIEFSTITH